MHFISSVQFSHSVMSNSLQPPGMQHGRLPCSSLSPGVCSKSHSLNWISNHSILCPPLLHLPSIFPSIRVFSSESVLCIRWPKHWSFSFSISLCNVYSGLIFLRTDVFDLFAVQGTLKSLLQHQNSKTSTLWHSAFFRVQLLHLNMMTGKTIMLSLYRPLSAKWCICFLTGSLGLSCNMECSIHIQCNVM